MVFSVGFCVIFNCSLATPLVESIHKQHKKQEKIKKAETPSSSPNVPTLALGSPYFHKDALKANSFRMGRHQGLKLTTFSWLPFPQILHSGASCLIVVQPVDLFHFLFPQAER